MRSFLNLLSFFFAHQSTINNLMSVILWMVLLPITELPRHCIVIVFCNLALYSSRRCTSPATLIFFFLLFPCVVSLCLKCQLANNHQHCALYYSHLGICVISHLIIPPPSGTEQGRALGGDVSNLSHPEITLPSTSSALLTSSSAISHSSRLSKHKISPGNSGSKQKTMPSSTMPIGAPTLVSTRSAVLSPNTTVSS
jgi:hypothetical protein